MSLIICTECGKQFSNKANNCPNCGSPVQSSQNRFLEEPPVVTIQKTYKKWKLVKLLSWVSIIIGFLSFAGGETGAAVGGLLICLGIAGLIVGKLGAWWTTG